MNDLTALIQELEADRKLGPQVAHLDVLPAQGADLRPWPSQVPESIQAALRRLGVERLYSHQARALEAIAGGRDLLVTTPTASGKSLIFHLPPLASELIGERGRALYLYPLKALGRDQAGKVAALAASAGVEASRFVGVYDGDTDREQRQQIRSQPPRVLITNPDMLHLGILPTWQEWTPFLADLKWVVLDELHAYRGVFGAHLHHVLWRLQRLCRRVGAEPHFIASSATAANADDFASALCGRSFEWIHDSGAPRERRHIAILDPIGSAYTAAVDLTTFLLDRGLKTIVFTKARRVTELIYTWLTRQRPDLAPRIANYRSGFLAAERRQIEADLFEGKIDGVVSTSALEMGIDVGGLDACVLVGFPGSVMATWQRSGRVGRQGRDSLTALVPLPDALDRYLVDHPDELTSREFEPLIVDPENRLVVEAHLCCAASEEPLTASRDGDHLERHRAVVDAALQDGRLRGDDGGNLRATEGRPHNRVHLRGGGDTFLVLDRERKQTIGTLDGIRLLREGHPGAIYLHGGRQYQVKQLDFDARKVLCERVSVNYFTQPLTDKRTDILEVQGHTVDGGLEAWRGRLRVTERVVGFERRKISSREVLDRHELDLPPMVGETEGLWWAAPLEVQARLVGEGFHFMGSLHAAEHAAIGLLPLFGVCDRSDLGGISIPLHPQVRTGAVFVYDGHAGGAGITATTFGSLRDLLHRVGEHLERCDCEDGCPSCVHSPKCGNGNRPLDKAGARAFLELLLAERLGTESPEGMEDLVEVRPEWEEPGWTPPPPPEDARASGKYEFDGPEPQERRGTGGWLSGLDSEGTEEQPNGQRSYSQKRPRPPRPENPQNAVLFDLETQLSAADVGGWHNTHRMRVAVGVSLHLQSGEFRVFLEDRVQDLIDQLAAADLVVGYNIERFDYPVLSGYTGVDYVAQWPTLDLYQEVYRSSGLRVSMNALAQATLGEGKSADGLTSLRWVAEGKIDKVIEYCKRDVEVLRDLYLFGRQRAHLKLAIQDEGTSRIPVAW